MLCKFIPSSNSKVFNNPASFSVKVDIELGNLNTSKFLILGGNCIPVTAVFLAFISLNNGELFAFNIPPNCGQLLISNLFK